MASIFSYVHTYLLQNDGLVIEQLGALVTTYKPAAYSEREQKMLPPRKAITFSKRLLHKDKNFIQYIADEMGSSIDEAGKAYAEFCEQVKQDLAKKGEVVFPVAGKLVKKELHYIFQQEPDFTCYGPSLGHAMVNVKHPASTATTTTYKPAKRKSYKWVGWVALALLLLSVGYMGFFTTLLDPVMDKFLANDEETELQQEKRARIESMTEAAVDSLATTDSVAGYIVEHLEKTTEPRQALYFETPEGDTLANGEMHYFLIAGSFRHRTNALMFQDQLKKKGYQSQLMKSEKELYRIALDSFRSEDTALTVMARIRARGDIESVWLLNAVKDRR